MSHLPYYLPDYNKQDHEVLVGEPERTLPEYRAPYAPIWNVIVRDKSTMDDHRDIDGNAMVLLLAQLYRSVVLSSFDPEVIEGLRKIAHLDPSPCADIPL